MNQTKKRNLLAYPYIQMIGCEWLIKSFNWEVDSKPDIL
jgi:hypothetical protein